MAAILVRYQVESDQAEHNEQMIRAVFAELFEQRPEGLAYTSWRLADGTFVHLADLSDAAVNPLNQTNTFAEFTDGLADRCVPGGQPLAQLATLVGRYPEASQSAR